MKPYLAALFWEMMVKWAMENPGKRHEIQVDGGWLIVTFVKGKE